MKETLVLWEISRKQSYIFQSNKLIENKGASTIIEYLTEDFPKSLDGFGGRIEDAEIYSGGGSSLYKFRTKDEARSFIRELSTGILRNYPGVEPFMITKEMDYGKENIVAVMDECYRELAKKKDRRKNSGVQLSFGIERKCESTGLPAVKLDRRNGEERFISESIDKKIKASDDKDKKMQLDKLLPQGYEAIKNVNQLVKGDKKYIGVVHVDGNRMGARISAIKEKYANKAPDNGDFTKINNAYLKELKEFSDFIKEAYKSSFKEMTDSVEIQKEEIKEFANIEEGIFPVVPIIFSGDDITFIANGKIAIDATRILIENINKKTDIDGKTMNACGGVAIVRAGYPFFKAYELAEDLCSNAKRKLREDYPNSEGSDYSLIDWHIEQGDILGSIKEIREENYKTNDGKELFIRPLYINNENEWTNYKNFLEACDKLVSAGAKPGKKEQSVARSKLKEIRDVFKKGEQATKRYMQLNLAEKDFPAFMDVYKRSKENEEVQYCFYEGKCMYFDIVEAMDYFKKLKDFDGGCGNE